MKVEGERSFRFRSGPLIGHRVLIPDRCPVCFATWMVAGTFKLATGKNDDGTPRPIAVCQSCSTTMGWNEDDE